MTKVLRGDSGREGGTMGLLVGADVAAIGRAVLAKIEDMLYSEGAIQATFGEASFVLIFRTMLIVGV
jgi:hypothetical protein